MLIRIGKKNRQYSLAGIFFVSSMLFDLGTLFGAYSREIADIFWFIVFYIFELLFLGGLLSGRVFFGKRRNNKNNKVVITKNGKYILTCFNIIAIISFVYFFILYYKIIQIQPLKEKRNPTIKIDDVG